MITQAFIRDTIATAVASATDGREVFSFEQVTEAATHAVMKVLKAGLEHDGLIITHGGHHRLDANDKTVWRAEAVAGVAAHVDPDSPSASAMIARRFARRP